MNKYQKALDGLVNSSENLIYHEGKMVQIKNIQNSKTLQELVDKVPYYEQLEAKSTPKKPLIKYYGEAGNKSTKVCCPNGCGIQLNGLDKEGESRAYTNDYCNKCGQAINWTSDE